MKPFMSLFEPQHPQWSSFGHHVASDVPVYPLMFSASAHGLSCYPSCKYDEPGRWTPALECDVGFSHRDHAYLAALAGERDNAICLPDVYPGRLGTELGDEIEWQP